MIEKDIKARGIRNAALLAAMSEVDRVEFVPTDLQMHAYDDGPLPIGEGQTISQPYIVALMIHALKLEGSERVLDIGTGSGYSCAVLSKQCAHVYSIERIESLSDSATKRLERLGYHNVDVMHGDGTLGWPEHAPYDAIVVAAVSPSIPAALQDQLAIGGRLVIPVGKSGLSQDLVRVTRTGADTFEREGLGKCRFVPLIGKQGWPDYPD